MKRPRGNASKGRSPKKSKPSRQQATWRRRIYRKRKRSPRTLGPPWASGRSGRTSVNRSLRTRRRQRQPGGSRQIGGGKPLVGRKDRVGDVGDRAARRVRAGTGQGDD